MYLDLGAFILTGKQMECFHELYPIKMELLTL